jgi:hypothetical protein
VQLTCQTHSQQIASHLLWRLISTFLITLRYFLFRFDNFNCTWRKLHLDFIRFLLSGLIWRESTSVSFCTGFFLRYRQLVHIGLFWPISAWDLVIFGGTDVLLNHYVYHWSWRLLLLKLLFDFRWFPPELFPLCMFMRELFPSSSPYVKLLLILLINSW